MTRVAVAITCHNRAKETLACLRALMSADFGGLLEVFLTDDGSTDGTGDLVARQFPEVRILAGSGDLFWAGGTALALRAAASGTEKPDYYLWLNDDVILEPSALLVMLRTASAREDRAVVVGAVKEPELGTVSYGAFVSVSRWNPLRLRLLEPSDSPRLADTMNGNVVLVPRIVAESLGNLDLRFPHNGADMDYAYRARRAGYAVVLAPGILGTCAANRGKHDWLDADLGLADRWRKVRSVKAFPVSGWFRFCRLYGGPFWPAVFCSPYVRCLLAGLRRRGGD